MFEPKPCGYRYKPLVASVLEPFSDSIENKAALRIGTKTMLLLPSRPRPCFMSDVKI